MSIRHNITHNFFVHPFCGVIWLVGDLMKLCGLTQSGNAVIAIGETIHDRC